MTMMRWDPFSEMTSLRQAMDQLLEQSFIRPSGGPAGGQSSGQDGYGFPIDVQEQGDALVVTASLPGIKPEDVDIQIRQNVLMITGEHQEEQERQQGRYLLAERRTGRLVGRCRCPSPSTSTPARQRLRTACCTSPCRRRSRRAPSRSRFAAPSRN
jgi:HSP20 family protein